MRTLMAVLVALVLWTGVGYAAPQWEFVCTERDIEQYLDINSVKVFIVGDSEIIKAQTKDVYSDTKYDICYYKIAKDSKNYMTYQWDTYINGELKSQFIHSQPIVRSYNPSNKVVNEILKRAGQ